jgi:Uma2 family endonuclease
MCAMGLPVEKRRYTIDEYLKLEFDSALRHEFHDGEILEMAGGTYEHSLIKSNLIRELGNALKGEPCRVLESDLRVRINRKPLYVYPDISVVCGLPRFDPQDARNMTILNPRVVIEVLSPSTEAYDRGVKFNQYREIETFQEYVLVAQDQPSVETYLRQQSGGSWLLTPCSGLTGSVRIQCLDVTISLAEIYAGIEWPEVPSQ